MNRQLTYIDAMLIPADGRPPSMISLMTRYGIAQNLWVLAASRMPHPEIYMDYIAEDMGSRAWKYQLVEALDGMNKKFANPYIMFYPTMSRDGMPFPINKCIKEIQGKAFREEYAWRGNIVIAKYKDNPFSSLQEATMADFPIIKNYLLTHGSPGN